MFGFLMDAGNYEQRKVGRDDFEWGFVSTVAVSDGRQPYETAVQHKQYGDGGMVIVESYATKEAAALGHTKWVAIMTAEKLPKKLVECYNAWIAELANTLGADYDKELRE